MTEVQNSGVSRRRIIQGAAWATPAIMIAAAAPAAASSGATASLTLVSPTASKSHSGNNHYIDVATIVSAVVLASAPATGTQVKITVSPGTQIVHIDPTVISATGWSIVSRTVSGSDYSFTYQYNSNLTSTSGASNVLSVRIHTYYGNNSWTANVKIDATATSGVNTLNASQASITVN